MNKLREELNGLLTASGGSRPAALRRSLQADFLYATDLPKAAGPETVKEFLRLVGEAGWHAAETAGWIQLDKITDNPPERCGYAGPEARCCAALLRQHPGERRNGNREKRILIKAAEEGPAARERACAALHREWAENLRRRERLPDLTENWFEEEGTC